MRWVSAGRRTTWHIIPWTRRVLEVHLAERMTAGTPLKAEVRVSGTPRALDASLEHHLFRIGVEALTNAIKHSGAARVDVALRFSDDAVHLVVTDDGAGFATTTTRLEHVGGHFGLRGIRERVDKMGGALTLENRAEGGAVVAVRIPLNGANNKNITNGAHPHVDIHHDQ